MLLARSATWRVVDSGDRASVEAAEAHAMAVRIGSDVARSRAATAVALTLRNIDRATMLASANEAIQLRTGTFSSETFFAYGQKLEALLGLGDLDGLAHAVEVFERDFESSPVRSVPGYRALRLVSGYNAAMTLALLRGRLDEAERLIAEVSAHEARRVYPIGFAFIPEFGATEVAYFRGDWAGATEGWERTRAIVPSAMDVYFGFSGVGCTLAELKTYVDAWFRIDATSPLITKASNVAVVAVWVPKTRPGMLSRCFARPDRIRRDARVCPEFA